MKVIPCIAAGLALAMTRSVAARNPQFEGADPHAMMIGDELWIFPTGGPGGSWAADRFGAFSSRDLKNWRPRGELIRRDQIGWIKDDGAPEHFLWAPGVATRNGKYYSITRSARRTRRPAGSASPSRTSRRGPIATAVVR